MHGLTLTCPSLNTVGNPTLVAAGTSNTEFYNL